MKSPVTDWLNNHVSGESYEYAMSDVQGDMSDNDFVLSERPRMVCGMKLYKFWDKYDIQNQIIRLDDNVNSKLI